MDRLTLLHVTLSLIPSSASNRSDKRISSGEYTQQNYVYKFVPTSIYHILHCPRTAVIWNKWFAYVSTGKIIFGPVFCAVIGKLCYLRIDINERLCIPFGIAAWIRHYLFKQPVSMFKNIWLLSRYLLRNVTIIVVKRLYFWLTIFVTCFPKGGWHKIF